MKNQFLYLIEVESYYSLFKKNIITNDVHRDNTGKIYNIK